MVKSILGQCNEFNCLSAIVVILVVEFSILLYNPSCEIQVLTLSYQWVYLDILTILIKQVKILSFLYVSFPVN